MADTQSQQNTQQDSQSQQSDWSGEERRNQARFDQLFAQQVTSTHGSEIARDTVAAYFDLAEQTIRTARRVGEVQAMSLMRQEIVKDVCLEIQRNPQWVASALEASGLRPSSQ
jgi:hypothetical protein